MAQVLLDGIPFSSTVEQLMRLCSPFGTVRHVEIATTPDGTPLGYARIEMSSEKEADALCAGLHEHTLSDHVLSATRVD